MVIPLLEFITGRAGTGKTTLLRQRIADWKKQQEQKGSRYSQRKYATLAATTGIAAINLSGNTGDTIVTINSELGYFDTNSLKDAFASRKLHKRLMNVSKKGLHLAIDEVSMMDAAQLDLIYDALVEVNDTQEVNNRGGLGLILSGDFCQLPPVKAPFAFTAKCWSKFQITKLEKIWRQTDLEYIEALNAARNGDGKKASEIIYSLKEITKRDIVDSHFDGTTIVPVNKLVDSINQIRLNELIAEGKRILEFKSYRWGKQLGEWRNIPEVRIVAEGAYVMILANDSPTFSYANGSCGHVLDGQIDTGKVHIKLVDNQKEVDVRKVTRRCYQKETPEGCIEIENWLSKKEWKEREENKIWLDSGTMADLMYRQYLQQLTTQSKMDNGNNRPYFDFEEEKWVIGEVTYTPIRLAYATTVHKSQGLSLDLVQIDYTHAFFGEPSMSYVALSRCRTPGGLTVVGSRRLIEDRTNISEEILEWL